MKKPMQPKKLQAQIPKDDSRIYFLQRITSKTLGDEKALAQCATILDKCTAQFRQWNFCSNEARDGIILA